MQELSSKSVVASLHTDIRSRTAALIDNGIDPHLAVILIGEDPQSLTYVEMKEARAKEDGIILSLYHLDETVDYEEVVRTVGFLGEDPEVHGIIIQLPLPSRFSKGQLESLIACIPASKDVDGLRGAWEALQYTATSIKALSAPQAAPLPPMVLAVMSLLDHYKVGVQGKRIVIVGKGRLVGAPLTRFFHKLGLNVEAVDDETDNIIATTKEADILITGTGEPDLVTYQWVKEGATVIDCSGDVHADSVGQIAGGLSPAKGGIGPLTTAWLLHNVVNAAAGASHV